MIMKTFSLNFNLIYFQYLFLLALFTFYSTIGSTQKIPIPSDPIGDIVCELVHCGQGVCKVSNETLLGFDCECNPGWKKIPIGPFTYPACVIPNCTVNFQCDGSASPPPPPAPVVPPPGCEFVWCGDGTCVANGTGHICQCPEGTWNLLDTPELACFKACYLGGDCKSKGFGAPEKSDTASSLKYSVTCKYCTFNNFWANVLTQKLINSKE
ncbi:hypothetical protein C1H46_009940 [Malus baccata]|uniref:EGF-like domain-containing protein n=1 Tax=Malus baccata TaxID=106549 RepID=A0A540N1L6_MALBA|nr:hypothetical protein C1H46_009940 [Malus baccata]